MIGTIKGLGKRIWPWDQMSRSSIIGPTYYNANFFHFLKERVNIFHNDCLWSKVLTYQYDLGVNGQRHCNAYSNL